MKSLVDPRRLFLMLVLAATAMYGASGEAAPTQPYIQLTQGIVGGYETAQPTRWIITNDTRGRIKVWRETASLEYSEALLSAESYQRLLAWFENSGFLGLPLERPGGGEDIYGYDVSVHIQTVTQEWVNRAAGGCTGHASSSVQPTAEQKALFKQGMDQIRTLLHAGRLVPSTAETFHAVERRTLLFELYSD